MTRLIAVLTLVIATVVPTIIDSAERTGDSPVVPPAAPPNPKIANLPKVPGTLRMIVRERREDPKGSGRFEVVERSLDWEVRETAIIVCDMWDDHHCKLAAQRVGVMAPRMNQVLTAARDRGVTVIFAPSETMNIYAGSPHRTRMEQARPAMPSAPIEKRCLRNPACEPATLPVDTNLDCDDCELGPVVRRHTRQHLGLDITSYDGVSVSSPLVRQEKPG